MSQEQSVSGFIPIEDINGPNDGFYQQLMYLRQRSDYIERMREQPYEPGVMFIVTRYDCPFSCDHCFFHSNPTSRTVFPREKLDESIDFAAGLGVQAIMLSGGEPMLDPEGVFSAVGRIRSLGMEALIQSSFLGTSEDEVRNNARRLAEVGISQFITSLSLYHEASKPSVIEMDYLDYLVLMIDELTKNGIKIGMKNPWDPARGDPSIDQANDFIRRLATKGDLFMIGDPAGTGSKIFGFNGQTIDFIDPSIISVGKARQKGMISQKRLDWEEELYNCPIFYEVHHDGGMLVVYPDGNVARCCSSERSADFAFGNLFTDSWTDIMTNIRNSPYVQPDMDEILREGHAMLTEEFPHLLPKEGATQPCEICSPIVSRPKLRRRLAERLGQPNLFVPFTKSDSAEAVE